ncbi:class I adenylate-forming enzyme family protein [Sporosarcina sp. FSL W7-1349]|uniref:class I adenylate-forming enzyme family protein n=1 Tax=Sporosarcina sp. FSL W7-1349 TaxID=2921561 RepID=UPI0030FB322B
MKKRDDVSVYGLLEYVSNEMPDVEAIYDFITPRKTYKELKQDVDRYADLLTAQGIEKGDRIAVSLPNWYETAVLLFAAGKVGAITVPFNPGYRSYEITYILRNATPKILFITDKFADNMSYEEAYQIVPTIVGVKFSDERIDCLEDWLHEEVLAVPEVPIDPAEDVYLILYTSGTTGDPKGVMLTHRSCVMSGNVGADGLQCTEKDVFIISAPLFHIFGIAMNLFTATAAGARMVLIEKYNPKLIFEVTEKEKGTIKQAVPTMYLKELEYEDFDKYDLSSLRAGVVAASPISPDKVKEIRKKFNINLIQAFGTSETATTTVGALDDPEEKILNTLGRPIKGVEIKIVDANRVEIPAGEVGEIAIRGVTNMKGYYNMPEQTAKAVDHEGWYYSGDLGKVDEEGYLTFVGRQKELIIRGGFNIYPQEIENLIMQHPAVGTAIVIGLPDKVLGEVVCAVIKLLPNESCTEQEILDHLKSKIATYKLPNHVRFTDEFPLTPSGKIQKMRVKEQIVNEGSVRV